MSPPHDKLLVLDLDETLVHASKRPVAGEAAHGKVGAYFIYHRPELHAFLAHVKVLFREVAIWTASGEDYAREVLADFPQGIEFSFVWTSERCSRGYDYYMRQGSTKKDLKKLLRLGYEREAVLFVDDTPSKISRSYGNYVRIKPFQGDSSDRELAYLASYLEELAPLARVRNVEKRHWRARASALTWSNPKQPRERPSREE